MRIGESIRKLRKKENMTQIQLASKIKVSEQLISSWENSERIPRIREIIKLADFFKISIDDLVYGKEV